MSLFGGSYRDDPVVVNLSQNLEFHKNHHVGVVEDTHPVGEETPRRVVEWKPKDAIERGEAERVCRSSVRQDRVVEFQPGSIAPRGVIWLLPDKRDQLRNPINKHSELGPFFSNFFRHQEVMRGLRYKARTESEVMQKLRFATQSTELDSEVARAFNKHLDSIQQRAEEMNSSGGDS